jgi:hypothetical protein
MVTKLGAKFSRVPTPTPMRARPNASCGAFVDRILRRLCRAGLDDAFLVEEYMETAHYIYDWSLVRKAQDSEDTAFTQLVQVRRDGVLRHDQNEP